MRYVKFLFLSILNVGFFYIQVALDILEYVFLLFNLLKVESIKTIYDKVQVVYKLDINWNAILKVFGSIMNYFSAESANL